VAGVPSEPSGGLTSFRRFMWWSLTGTTVCVLVFGVGDWLLDRDAPLLARIPGGVALVVTVVASAVLLSRRLARPPGGIPGRRPAQVPVVWLVAGSVGAAVFGGILLAVGNDELWSYAPGTMVAIAATFRPARQRRLLIAAAVAAGAALGGLVALVSGDGVVYAAAFPAGLVALIAWTTLGMLWSLDVADRLDEARQLSAELAVKDERLRFAADLHDIQGHHLQVIALKGELAARLVDHDPERAAAEMKEVQRLATDALQDTRAVVQGYRRTTLDDEIANATRVMAAADVDARMDLGPAPAAGAAHLADASRHLLGLVMREATTNVLRHSQAQHAEVRYRVTDGVARLRMSNDGAVDQPGSATGTGLRTLAERLEAAGGSLTWGHDGDRFVVAASLPANGSEESDGSPESPQRQESAEAG
jgi:two-component system, NarL family, sensor histidine kinase DesK